MLRAALEFLLVAFVARAFWRLMGGVMQGLAGGSAEPTRSPERSAHMARDPVCGTFVLPERALKLGSGRDLLFFCSTACLDRYRAQRSPQAPRAAGSQGARQ